MRISDWSSDVCSSDLIGGVEELKSDFQSNKPEISVRIDRERARREGISTAQIGLALGNALYGKEVSKFRDEKDRKSVVSGKSVSVSVDLGGRRIIKNKTTETQHCTKHTKYKRH